MKRLALILFLLTLSCGLRAQYVVGTLSDGSVYAVPYSFDTDIRAIRQNAFPDFHNPYGDYLQYGPIVLIPVLKAFGVPTRDMEREMPYIGSSSLKDLEEYTEP